MLPVFAVHGAEKAIIPSHGPAVTGVEETKLTDWFFGAVRVAADLGLPSGAPIRGFQDGGVLARYPSHVRADEKHVSKIYVLPVIDRLEDPLVNCAWLDRGVG